MLYQVIDPMAANEPVRERPARNCRVGVVDYCALSFLFEPCKPWQNGGKLVLGACDR